MWSGWGWRGRRGVRVLTSTERHGSLTRALRLLGLGTECVELLGISESGHLLESELARALGERPGVPAIVVLQAGDVNIGAFDDFARLIPLAKQHGAWVHVDGAFGLWAGASAKLAHLCAGVAEADSWATDGHKYLNVPV